MSRRGFLQALATSAVASAGSWALAAPADQPWSCPLFGDLHFDRLDHHDHQWLASTHPNDVRQVQNYSRLTSEVLPGLFATVKRQLAAATATVPFVLQLGDLIEGLCGAPELARRQLDEALAFIRQADFQRPLLLTKGNHDITGPGAREAYEHILVPALANPALDAIHAAHFTQRRGGRLLVFYDAYEERSLEWFEKLVADHQPLRPLFLIHPPVVPYNARSSWHIYSKPTQAAQRERLLALLGQTQAIVLCGHLHKFAFLRRRTPHGSFTQLAISSIATNRDGQPRHERQGIEEYRPDLVELEPQHSPETLAARRALLAAEQPHIEHFEYADTWGYAWLEVAGPQVTARIYRGTSESVWKTLRLE